MLLVSDQMHPTDTTYTSSTDYAHNHLVTLTASQLSTIASGGAVTVTSTASTVTGNHRPLAPIAVNLCVALFA